MKVACLCCTCNRPRLLEEVIESFNRQTIPADQRELIILDDLGQYLSLDTSNLPANVRVISTAQRFPSLGDKRNACASYASDDATIFSIWDDDDIYSPRHLEILLSCLRDDVEWVGARRVIVDAGSRTRVWQTGGVMIFQGSWMYTRNFFERHGRYPSLYGTEDQVFWERVHRNGGSIYLQDIDITYVYRTRAAANRICMLGCHRAGYTYAGDMCGVQPVTKLVPHWTIDWERFINDTKTSAAPSVQGVSRG